MKPVQCCGARRRSTQLSKRSWERGSLQARAQAVEGQERKIECSAQARLGEPHGLGDRPGHLVAGGGLELEAACFELGGHCRARLGVQLAHGQEWLLRAAGAHAARVAVDVADHQRRGGGPACVCSPSSQRSASGAKLTTPELSTRSKGASPAAREGWIFSEADAALRVGQPLLLRVGGGDAHHLGAGVEEAQRVARTAQGRLDADPAGARNRSRGRARARPAARSGPRSGASSGSARSPGRPVHRSNPRRCGRTSRRWRRARAPSRGARRPGRRRRSAGRASARCLAACGAYHPR